MATRVLDVRHLSVSFETEAGRTQALDDVSFSIDAGEILALVGESGSGKSVAAMSVLRLLPRPPAMIEQGQILFADQDLLQAPLATLRALRGQHIGAIFQEPMTALSPLRTIGAQLRELCALHRPQWPKAQQRDYVLDWLERVGIDQPQRRYNQLAHEFSGGMRQRVMIAQALMLSPRLLIADEPTTALDVTLQAQVFELLLSLKRADTAVLFITHDMGVVWQLCDQVVVMQRGEVVERGATDALFHAPSCDYTKALLDAVPRLSGASLRPAVAAVAPVLRAQNLQVDYVLRRGLFGRPKETLSAVQSVDLMLYPGQTLGLVGESGCGKSTLGRALIGLQPLTGGEIHYGGRDIAHLNRRARRAIAPELQMVFQDPYSSLNPRLPVMAQIIEAPSWFGLIDGDPQAFAAHWLNEVQLPVTALERYPHEFSGGQRQRVAIARALAMQPKVIVCDEAVSALDVTIQAQILALLMRLQARYHMAYLFISHDISVVKGISDQVMVMQRGQVIEQGTPAQVIDAPQCAYTQALIKAVPEPFGPHYRRGQD